MSLLVVSYQRGLTVNLMYIMLVNNNKKWHGLEHKVTPESGFSDVCSPGGIQYTTKVKHGFCLHLV